MPEEVYDGATEHREHRVGAWLVLLVGIVGFVLGAYHLRGRITGVFVVRSTFQTPDQIEAVRIQGMKTKDTDRDGITDFDETYIFKTSPYLEDSDSDDISDKEELAAGANPNCPRGRECGPLGDALPVVAREPDETDINDAIAAADFNLQPGDEQAVIDEFASYTPEKVRQLLREAGVPDEQLKNIDDAALMKMYLESLDEAKKRQEGSVEAGQAEDGVPSP